MPNGIIPMRLKTIFIAPRDCNEKLKREIAVRCENEDNSSVLLDIGICHNDMEVYAIPVIRGEETLMRLDAYLNAATI